MGWGVSLIALQVGGIMNPSWKGKWPSLLNSSQGVCWRCIIIPTQSWAQWTSGGPAFCLLCTIKYKHSCSLVCKRAQALANFPKWGNQGTGQFPHMRKLYKDKLLRVTETAWYWNLIQAWAIAVQNDNTPWRNGTPPISDAFYAGAWSKDCSTQLLVQQSNM